MPTRSERSRRFSASSPWARCNTSGLRFALSARARLRQNHAGRLVPVVQKVDVPVALERAWIALHVRIPAIWRDIDASPGVVPCPVRQVFGERIPDPIGTFAIGAKTELAAIAEEHVVATVEVDYGGQRLAFAAAEPVGDQLPAFLFPRDAVRRGCVSDLVHPLGRVWRPSKRSRRCTTCDSCHRAPRRTRRRSKTARAARW